MIETIKEKKVFLDTKLLSEIQEKNEEEKQVIVHFSIEKDADADMVRIWKSTYLIDKATGKKYPMVHAEGITYAPVWTPIPAHKPLEFTLIFKGLPKSCTVFDLIEIIPEDGGFELRNIQRNSVDIYYAFS